MDRGGNLLRFSRSKDKDDVRRWLLQGLKQRVEGLVREHVNFIDDVDLVLAAYRSILDGLAQLADVLDAAVRCSIDLDDVHRCACRRLDAGIAFAAGRGRRPLRAIQGFGEYPCCRGLSDAARTGEQEGMGQSSRDYRVLKRPGYMPLAHNIFENLGPPFSRQYLVTHCNLTSSFGCILTAEERSV